MNNVGSGLLLDTFFCSLFLFSVSLSCSLLSVHLITFQAFRLAYYIPCVFLRLPLLRVWPLSLVYCFSIPFLSSSMHQSLVNPGIHSIPVLYRSFRLSLLAFRLSLHTHTTAQ